MVHDLEFKPEEVLADAAAGGVTLLALAAGGSVGDALLFGVRFVCLGIGDELISTGEREKSPWCWT